MTIIFFKGVGSTTNQKQCFIFSDSNNRVVGPKRLACQNLVRANSGSFFWYLHFPKLLNMSSDSKTDHCCVLVSVFVVRLHELCPCSLSLTSITSLCTYEQRQWPSLRDTCSLRVLQCLAFCFHTFDTWTVITIGPSTLN